MACGGATRHGARTEEPKTVAMESGMASCSVNSPRRVKRGTSTAPPPMPAADASTVATKMAKAVGSSCAATTSATAAGKFIAWL